MAHILPMKPNLSGSAQPIRDALRMAQADGCPSCVANVESPTWVDEPMTGTGYIAHYRCTDCGHEWTTSWEDEA